MSQPLPYDETELWHGHLDLYLNIMEEVLKIVDDSDTGYIIEVDLRYPNLFLKKNKKLSIFS